MPFDPARSRHLLLASAISAALAVPAMAADVTITGGTAESNAQSVGGSDHLTVEQGGLLSVDGTAVKWQAASTDLVIDNDGTIESTEDGGRAINASGSPTAPRNLILNNGATGIIQSQSDAFRINIDITGGTVTVNNAGLIHSTVDGQALDFDAAESTGAAGAQIVINNAATGIIKADGADAIRPGQGATVNNAGTIYADGVIGDKNDGIDFQGHSGTVNNLAGGTISGQRHGITSDVDVTVYNAAGATITGRNGSGVGSDGNGTVVNYGRITGAYVGTGNGDGDGVDIDFHGVVENYGTIEGTGAGGVGSDGIANESEGVALTGGGTIINHEGGTISGATRAITATGGVHVENYGTIVGGFTGIGVGLPNDAYILNAGTITAPFAIEMHEENDTLVIARGSVINGLVDGGAGINQLFIQDGGVFDTATNFQTLQVDGAGTIIGDNAIGATTITAGSSLTLGNGSAAGSVGGDIVDQGTLILDRSDDYTLPGLVSGAGSLEQRGSGTTGIATAEAYTGGTTITDGTLALRAGGSLAAGLVQLNGGAVSLEGGSLAASDVAIAGGTLSGSGTLGSVTAAGGTVAPDGAGQLRVGGDVHLGAGSTYRVTLQGASSSGIVADGAATLEGGRLKLAVSTLPALGSSYTILSAAGGVEGQFGTIVTDDYPLITGDVAYGPASTRITITLNNEALVASAASANGLAAARWLAGVPAGGASAGSTPSGPLLNALIGLSADALPGTLNTLSGEIHASVISAIAEDALQLPQMVNSRLAGRDGTAGLWFSAEGADRRLDGGNGLGSVTGSTWGLNGGGEASFGSLITAGAMIGYHHGSANINARSSSSDYSGYKAAVYGQFGKIGAVLRVGAAYTRWDIDTDRRLSIGTLDSRLSSSRHANSFQAFGEGAYVLRMGKVQVEPFADLSWLRLKSDGWHEKGGSGALEGGAVASNATLGSLGLRLAADMTFAGFGVHPYAEGAWDHLIDAPRIRQSIALEDSTAGSLAIEGLPLAHDRGRVKIGADLVSGAFSIGAAYTRVQSSSVRENGVKIRLNWAI